LRLADGDYGRRAADCGRFWLTLFALSAAAVLGRMAGRRSVYGRRLCRVFFASRVWRSVIKRPLVPGWLDDPVRRAHQFLVVSAADARVGHACRRCRARRRGSGMDVRCTFFLIMGALQLVLLFTAAPRGTADAVPYKPRGTAEACPPSVARVRMRNPICPVVRST